MLQKGAEAKKLLCLDWDETVTNQHWHNTLSGPIARGGLDVRPGRGLNALSNGQLPLDVLLTQRGGFKNEAHIKQFILAVLKEHNLAITTFSHYPDVVIAALERMLAPEMTAQQIQEKIHIRAGFPMNNIIDKMLTQFKFENPAAVKETIYNILRTGDSAEKILHDLNIALAPNMNEEQIKENLFITRQDKSLVKLEGHPPVLLKGDPNDLICKQEHIRDAMIHFNTPPERTFLLDDSQRNLDSLNADSPESYSRKTGKAPLVVLPRENLIPVEKRWANPEPKGYLGVTCDRLKIERPEILKEVEYDLGTSLGGTPTGSGATTPVSSVSPQPVTPASLAAAFESAQKRHGAMTTLLETEKKKEGAVSQDKAQGAEHAVEVAPAKDKKHSP